MIKSDSPTTTRQPILFPTRSVRAVFSFRRPAGAVLAGGVLLLAAVTGRAQSDLTTAMSNLGQTPAIFASIGGSDTIGTPFTTGATAHKLAAVTLLNSSPVEPGYTLSLFSNVGGAPGTLLNTLTSPSQVPTGSYYATTFADSSADSLAANTTYWLIQSTTVGDNYYSPVFDNSATVVSAEGWTTGPLVFDGSSYAPHSVMLSIAVTPAPEPTTLALLAAGGLGALGLIRRRKN